MRVQVVRAWREGFAAEDLVMPDGACVADALRVTGIDQAGVAGYAIHGERADAQALLRDGDRLELLGPLLADPKEARRRRAVAQAGRPRG